MPKPISRYENHDFEPPARRKSPIGDTDPVGAPTQPPASSELESLKARFRDNPSVAGQAEFKERFAALRAASEVNGPNNGSASTYINPAPGYYAITDRTRRIDIRLIVGDPDAKDGVQDLITLTEAYSGGLPKGNGSALVVALLRHFGISLRPGGKLVCASIREESTVRAYIEYMQAKASPRDSATGPCAAQTKIGRFAAAIVSRLGLEVESIDWPSGSLGPIEITATTRAPDPTSPD